MEAGQIAPLANRPTPNRPTGKSPTPNRPTGKSPHFFTNSPHFKKKTPQIDLPNRPTF